MISYYDILGVSKNASQQEIKTAYKKLSLKVHPDANQSDKYFDDLFKNINVAYSVLSDPTKRKIHDEELLNPTNGAQGYNQYSTQSKNKIHNRYFELSKIKNYFKDRGWIFWTVTCTIALLIIFFAKNVFSNQGENEGGTKKLYRVTASRLNVRSAPNENAPIIHKIEKGGEISIDTIINNWGKLSVIKDGYVNMNYLTSSIEGDEKERTNRSRNFISNFFTSFFLSWVIIAFLSMPSFKSDGRFSSGKRQTSAGLGFGILTQIIISVIIALFYSIREFNS